MITFTQLGNFGRLGNQLWQIASTIGIAKHLDVDYAFPHWPYEEAFVALRGTNINTIEQIYNESTPYFNWPKIDATKNTDLRGYFQSYKYFQECEIEIKNKFTFLEDIEPINAVSIHVRRGDYLDLSHIHINLSDAYYNNAINRFKFMPRFIVFSDDIDYCKLIFVDSKIEFCTETDPIKALQLMSACKHNIIANSSFSWWAAWLNKNPDKMVIAPKQWVTTEDKDDRVPVEWFRV